MKILNCVLGFFGFLFVFFASKGFSETEVQSIVLNSTQSQIPITTSAEFLTVEEVLSAEQIASKQFEDHWQAYDGKGILRTSGDTELWLRFSLDNSHDYKSSWQLVMSWALVEHAQLSVFNSESKRWWRSRPIGSNYPVSNRYVNHRFLLFPLSLSSPEKKIYYLNIRSTNIMSLPITIRKTENLLAQGYIDMIIIGALFGSICIMFFYNMSLYFLLKDQTYIYYCFYILTVIFYLATLTGMGQLYFWDSSLWLKQHSFLIASVLLMLSGIIFGRNFLNIPSHGGWLLTTNNYLIALWVVIGVIGVFGGARAIIPLINTASAVTCAIGIVSSGYLWYRRYPAAKIFTFAWGTLIVSSLVFILALQGLLPMNKLTSSFQMIGFVMELVLLSVAVANRIKSDREAREYATSEALMLTKKVSEERRERLKAQKEAIELQRELNEELETHVAERTEQLRVAMEKLESANEELTKLSLTDPLTKVHNRRYFDDALIDEYKRAYRSKQMLAVIVVDIDHFKGINDKYGHDIGDNCIALVASTLKEIIKRPGDVVARYGGEEFVYILPGSDEKNAITVANNCRIAVENLEFSVQGQRVPLTISAGVAAWVPTLEGAYKQLLNAADTALYRAKSSGRNCVKTAIEPGRLAQV